MNVADKLATTIFNVDREAHITVQNEIWHLQNGLFASCG